MTMQAAELLSLSDHQHAIGARVVAEESSKREHVVIYLSGAHAYGFPSPDSDLARISHRWLDGGGEQRFEGWVELDEGDAESVGAASWQPKAEMAAINGDFGQTSAR